MVLKRNPLNFKISNSIWEDLCNELGKKMHSKITLIFPSKFSDTLFEYFKEIEKEAFRKELRYNYNEIKERLGREDILFLFIFSDSNLEGLVLGYSTEVNSKNLFFLDTLAVKTRGKGLGKIIMNHLIEWLQSKGYEGISIFTEDVNEKNIQLREFYEKLGFVLESIDNKQNLSMTLLF